MTRLLAGHRALSEATARVAALCVAVMALAYCAEVLARYFFSAPLNWSGDLSSYLLCACAFLALPKVTRDGAHVAVSLLVEMMGPRARRRYIRLLWYLTAAVCLFVTYFIAVEGIRQFDEGVLTTAATQIPRWWISAVVCYGLASSSLHLLTVQPEIALSEPAVGEGVL
jgi:TRAP-type C4-dicarboxylate transport system permease small subunit